MSFIAPQLRRARSITTAEGQHLNLNDIIDALNDDEFIRHVMMMLVVGQKLGAPSVECVRHTIADAILTLSGEAAVRQARIEELQPRTIPFGEPADPNQPRG